MYPSACQPDGPDQVRRRLLYSAENGTTLPSEMRWPDTTNITASCLNLSVNNFCGIFTTFVFPGSLVLLLRGTFSEAKVGL